MKLQKLIIFFILLISSFIRLYHITTDVPFFGDQGWFYISARDMLLTGHIPLVGITSSHTWLHQGPLWTYILGAIFCVTHFNPFTPFMFTAMIGILTTYLIYYVGKPIFGDKTSLIASFIFATSPLIIMQSRNAYHTSLFSTGVLLLLFSIYRLREKHYWFLPLITGLFALLYNLGLTNISIIIGAVGLTLIDSQLKQATHKAITNRIILLISLFTWLIGMVPMIIYDLFHHFPQTIEFSAWILYKLLTFLPNLVMHGIHQDPSLPFGAYSLTFIRQLIFLPQYMIALGIFSCITLTGLFVFYRKIKQHTFDFSEKILTTFFFVPLAFYIVQLVPSEGYIPIMFIGFCFFVSYMIQDIGNEFARNIFLLLIILVGLTNMTYMLTHRMLMIKSEYGYSLEDRLALTQQAKNHITLQPVRIIFHGPLEQFETNRMNYEYLLWWQGVKISQDHYQETVVITDDEKKLSYSVIK